jgi:thioredoxin-related protein
MKIKSKKIASILTGLIVLSIFTSLFLQAEEKKIAPQASGITWLKFDQGLEKAKKENKPVLVFFQANWCGWCKRMEKVTFQDPKILKRANENFILVKVNKDSKDLAKFGGNQITEQELARKYKVSGVPDTWFLKSTGEKVEHFLGYREPTEFYHILGWIKDAKYDSVSLGEYIYQEKAKGN